MPIADSRPGSLASRLAATTRVLGIEDDPDIAEFLRAYFRASGYDFVHCDPSAVGEALAAIEDSRPDCILLDMWLRGFSGIDVYRQVRSRPDFALTPVVVVTADATIRPRATKTATGIDGFVSKPFNVDTLATLVGERIEAARALADRLDAETASGVLTAALLAARLEDETALARATGTPVSFALVTLRSLAPLRDQLGDAGMTWLFRELAAEGRRSIPDHVVLARTDSGELAMLAPGATAEDTAVILEQLLDGLRGRRQVPGGDSVAVEPVAGVANFPAHAADAQELFMAADTALAEAADSGRDVAVAL